MSDPEEAFNIMRLGVASLILPLILLASAAMFYAGRWKVNTHAAASSFWTIFNLGILSFIAHMIFGINLNTLPGSREQIITAAPGIFIGFITLLYFGFRAYYKNFGIDSKFWRLD